MVTPSPATPAAPAAATPGSGEHGGNSPAGSPPAPVAAKPGEQGGNQAGQVTIPAEEYRKLLRADARTRAFDRRAGKSRPSNQSPNPIPVSGSDPDAIEALEQAQRERDEANRRALQADVRDKVRGLLNEDRFKNLPESTKILILDKPHMLSEADTLEEAMLDIEDKLDEIAAGIQNPNPNPNSNPNPNPNPNQNPNPNPSGSRETPPVHAAGAPAPVDNAVQVDTSKLTGSKRSIAVLQNTMNKAGVKSTTNPS